MTCAKCGTEPAPHPMGTGYWCDDCHWTLQAKVKEDVEDKIRDDPDAITDLDLIASGIEPPDDLLFDQIITQLQETVLHP